MPWPRQVVRQFEKVPPNPSEADFHGPYNKLLNTVFPPESEFTVVPQYMPSSRESADFLVVFEVILEDKPVLILELRSPSDLRYASKRRAADRKVRDRIHDLYADCPLPVLHAVSAMGTRLCFFHKRGAEAIQPPFIEEHPVLQTDSAPSERWHWDIIEDEGMRKFQDVVEEIKRGCAAL